MSSEAIRNSPKTREEFLPLELDYIPEDLRQRAKVELFEDEDTRINSLKLLRSVLKDETDLQWQDEDLFLLSFLRARKFDVKRAFQLMKTFYTVMGKHTELYYNFDFADVRRTIEENSVGCLPYRDSEGCAVVTMRICAWKPHINSMADIMRFTTCALLYASLFPATQIAGFKRILDASGLSLMHIPHISPSYLWLFAEAMQNCFPGRFRAVHIVNENHIFSYIWVIIKPFLSKKIKERIHFHGKNVKKLHKYFSPSILPAEYGGKLPNFDNSDWGKLMEERAEHFSHVFSYGYKKYKVKA